MRLHLALLGAVALVSLSPLVQPALAGTCRMGSDEWQMEYACPNGDAASSQPGRASEPWWASSTAQAVYAVVGLAASAGGGAYAYARVRSRRRTLGGFMTRIEEALAAGKATPTDGAQRLQAVRGDLKAAYAAHRVDDAHFLELDKRALAAVARLRTLELDARFPALPGGLRGQLAHLLADGTLSEAEVGLARAAVVAHPLPSRTRDDLLYMLNAWSFQDAVPVAPAAPAPPAPPPLLVRE